MLRKTFKYRLYPTTGQALALEGQLSEACRLYNAALQERRDAWRMNHVPVSRFDQSRQLKDIRKDGNLGITNAQLAGDVLNRVDLAFKAFFRRLKAGEKPGYPRFRSKRRYDSLTFPNYGNGCKLREGGKLYLQGVGEVKVKLHRPVAGKIKTVAVKREAGRWHVCFSLECEAAPLPESTEAVGIDVGLKSFAMLSDGQVIENPRHYRKAQAALRRAQRKVARRKKGGNGRRKAVRLLQRAHVHVRNQRSDAHHKAARQIVDRYGLIVVEDLNIKGLARGRLAKSVHDAGWAEFLAKLAYKAEDAGRVLVKVNPSNTSQVCSRCGSLPDVKKSLAVRVHRCDCGLVLDRDENAARNILRLGLSLADGTWPRRASVSAEPCSVGVEAVA